MSITSKGVPYPALDGSTDNDVPADVKALADWVDANPGVAIVTTAGRDALTGVDLWNGRVVLNTTTGQLNRYVSGSSSWVVVGVGDHGQLVGLGDDDHPQYLTGGRHDALDHAFLLAATGLPATPAFTGSRGSATKAARADHVHPVGVSEIASSSAPTSWPAGISVMQVLTAPDWPFTYGTVLTFRSDSGYRVVQIAVESGSGAVPYTRSSVSPSEWGTWRKSIVEGDPRLTDARTPLAHTHPVAAGALLASKSYSPGADVTLSTTSSTLVDVDATNLAVTFTVPASGKVLVRLEAVTDSVNFPGFWGLRNGTTTVAEALMGDAGTRSRKPATFLVTGLTPGASLTYKWGHHRDPVGGTDRIYAGPAASFGPATMEVYAA